MSRTLEAQAAGVRVAGDGADDPPGERDLAGPPGELARREGRRAPAGDRGVQEEDGEHRRDRERDHEPRR